MKIIFVMYTIIISIVVYLLYNPITHKNDHTHYELCPYNITTQIKLSCLKEKNCKIKRLGNEYFYIKNNKLILREYVK